MEEGYPSLPRQSTSQHGLAGTGRSLQQDAVRDFRTEPLIALRVPQELQKFGNLALGILLPRDIRETDLRRLRLLHGLHPAAQEISGAAPAAQPTRHHSGHPRPHEEPEGPDQQPWQQTDKPGSLICGAGLNLDTRLLKRIEKRRIAGRGNIGNEGCRRAARAS